MLARFITCAIVKTHNYVIHTKAEPISGMFRDVCRRNHVIRLVWNQQHKTYGFNNTQYIYKFAFLYKQDEDGEARRRRRRREREHGSDSEHSYYSVVSAGGTRHVRRKKRHADGTYSRSVSFHSGHSDAGKGSFSSRENYEDEEKEDSDVSFYSEVSEGGTRHQMQKKRIRDEDGNVIGYGDAEPAKPRKDGSKAGARGNIAHLYK